MSVSRRTLLTATGVGAVAAATGATTPANAAKETRFNGMKPVGDVTISKDLKIHYESSGHGDTAVIFVPGWTMATPVFRCQLEHFRHNERFRAIAYDPRAQGKSSYTIDGHYYEQRGRDLQQFIEKLGISQFILVGWSAAGGDILEYVRLFGKENLRGIVLLDTCPKVRGHDYTKEWLWFGTKDNGDQDGQLQYFSYDVMVDRERVNREFAAWMLDDPSEEKIDYISKISNQTRDSVAALTNTSYWFLDNTPQVEELNGSVPLLYFTRHEVNELAQKWAQEHTPDAVVESYGKHLMFWEHPEIFNESLDRFLAKIET